MSIRILNSFDTMCELDSRTGDGLEVRMLWSESSGAIVSVLDTRTGESFTIDVRTEDSPSKVFHHPYAYAAARERDDAVVTGPAAFAA